jgi:hypothetical protein
MRLAIEELGPTFVKFGQIMSTRQDMLPPELIIELKKLQDQVAPLPFSEIRKVIETECPNHEECFSSIDEIPLASASIAQVHRAKLKDGTPVALKIQEAIPHAGEYFVNSSNQLANYSTTSFIKNKEFRITTKIDHQLTKANRLSGRYTQVPIRADKGCCDFQIGVNELNSGGTDYSSSRQL